MVLVGKVDLPQKLLPKYNFESRVLSIIFQIHYLWRELVPKNQGTPPSLTIFEHMGLTICGHPEGYFATHYAGGGSGYPEFIS